MKSAVKQNSSYQPTWALRPIVVITLSVFASLSYGAEPVGEATLGSVEVTAKKNAPSPSTEQLKTNDIAAQKPATSDTASLLKNAAGVQLNGAGGVSSLPSIRGLADDRLRIKVNGIDYISACANHMNPALSYIDPTQVGSVKIYSGATPVGVGGDSIGGAIVVNGKEPQFAQAGQVLRAGEIGGFYRSNGNGIGGNLSATLATDKLSLNFNSSTAQSDNYKSAKTFKPDTMATGTTIGNHLIAGDEVASSAYNTQNHELSAAYKSGNHIVDAKFGYQHILSQGFPNQHMDMTGNDSTSINVGYKGAYDWGNLSARYYNEHTRHEMNFAEDKLFWYGPIGMVPGMPMDTAGRNIGASLKGDIALSDNHLLKIGTEYQRYRLSDWWSPSGGGMWPNTFVNINNGQRDRLGLFGDLESNWSEKWATQVGVRFERVKTDTGTVQGYNTTMANYLAESKAFNARDRKRTDNNIDINLSARYSPNDSQTFEGAFTRKTRSPNLYERYTWSTGGMAMAMNNWVNDGNGYVGNMDLKPEVAHTLSFTANLNKAKWGVKFSPYYTEVTDYIDAACAPGKTCKAGQFNPLTLVNQNARLYGADLSAYASLGSIDGVGAFKAQAAIGYIKGTNKTTGDNLYNIMPLNGKLSLTHTLGKWSNTIETELVKSKNSVSQARYEIKTAGYGLLNLRSSYEWKNLRLDVGVENVLNKQYALPLGGAYIGQGRTMSLNGAGAPYGIQVAGAGRSFYAGLNAKF
ncbi:MAG: TonB-dependent receptor [Burkholderiaceae bacterium]|nr:TonB-dependent receptor [Burkholderiaceae bacterium]